MKLNNYDKKNLKKKMIIDNLRLKHIEDLHVQIVDERERYSKLLLEKDKLTREVDKKKYYYIEIFNRGMITLNCTNVHILRGSRLISSQIIRPNGINKSTNLTEFLRFNIIKNLFQFGANGFMQISIKCIASMNYIIWNRH